MASALSTCSSGVTQTGQPGPVDHPHALGQRLVDPLLDDRVRLPAADLHERPRPGGDPVDLGDQLPGEDRVAVLVEVLHCSPPRRCGSPSPIRAGVANSCRRRPVVADHGRRVHPRAHRLELGRHHGAHLLEHLERLERLGLVHLADREADVHDDVVAELHLGDVGQAGVLAHAAEVDLAHRQGAVVADLDHLARDAKTTSVRPPFAAVDVPDPGPRPFLRRRQPPGRS